MSTFEERAADRQRRALITVFRPGSTELAARFDEEYWLQIPLDERMAFAHEMTMQQWRLRGWNPDSSSGLPRSLTVVRRP